MEATSADVSVSATFTVTHCRTGSHAAHRDQALAKDLCAVLEAAGYTQDAIRVWWAANRHPALNGRTVSQAWEDGDRDEVVSLITRINDDDRSWIANVRAERAGS